MYAWCLRCYCVKHCFYRHPQIRNISNLLSSLLLQFYWQSGTHSTHINHQILYFSSLNIPTRMYRKYPAVNTLYIFMFWKVLLDHCVSIERQVFCNRHFLSVEGTLISFPAFINESISLADMMWLSEVCIYISPLFSEENWHLFYSFIDDWLKWFFLLLFVNAVDYALWWD